MNRGFLIVPVKEVAAPSLHPASRLQAAQPPGKRVTGVRRFLGEYRSAAALPPWACHRLLAEQSSILIILFSGLFPRPRTTCTVPVRNNVRISKQASTRQSR